MGCARPRSHLRRTSRRPRRGSSRRWASPTTSPGRTSPSGRPSRPAASRRRRRSSRASKLPQQPRDRHPCAPRRVRGTARRARSPRARGRRRKDPHRRHDDRAVPHRARARGTPRRGVRHPRRPPARGRGRPRPRRAPRPPRAPPRGGGRRDRPRLLSRLRTARPPARALPATPRARGRGAKARGDPQPCSGCARAGGARIVRRRRRAALLLLPVRAARRPRARLLHLVRRQRDVQERFGSAPRGDTGASRPDPHRDRRAVPLARAVARAAERARARGAHASRACAGAGRGPGRAGGAGRRERAARVRIAVSVAPKKELGQHFLVDENILGVIGRLAELADGDVVLEVGPGLGVLTRYLANHVAHVHAVELDRSLEEPMRETLGARSNVDLVFGDALQLDLAALEPAPAKLVANLPYNVATPIVAESLDGLTSLERWCVMVQREVADRFFAEPRTKAYGAVSVLLQLRTRKVGFHPVPPTVFRPRPNVDSALVAFRRTALPENYAWVKRVVGAAFAHRRKTLPNSLELSGLMTRAEAAAALERIGRDPGVRAEALEPHEFVELTRAL